MRVGAFLMAMTWVICGAGRGCGKTHLSRRLCEVLPDSVYAKQGCGKPRPGKPPNFFKTEKELALFIKGCRDSYRHIVVESNTWARKGKGDVIVFADGIPRGGTGVRDDVGILREKSHVQISPSVPVGDYGKALRSKVADPSLLKSVCEVFSEQRRFISRSGLAVRTKVWFVADDEHVFGSGLARLLENLDSSGTLRAAARATHMSYRFAWGLIKNAEEHLGRPLTLTQAGGEGGGRTHLSVEGKRILDRFRRLGEEVSDFADKRFAALRRKEAHRG